MKKAIAILMMVSFSAVAMAQMIPASVEQDIKKQAASKWHGDYTMQAYEVSQQKEAYKGIQSYKATDLPSATLNNIKKNAANKWPGDYTMQLYEIKEQVRGYRNVNRK